ncbi:Alpha/beta hydrolase family protein [Methyloligella halotolerans]|uniref:Alpha/beta hydrolase family protein n=1 Tax=Methyloligella halotolerans TaxID=1177755 RepID=A0A1E2S0J8_9HYPH|nr:alpha/beta hydrolase [Methyloligella halotolerans]ODA67845.1 Alpha/beta hydrolase family protein [Methyloligella halotolerans]
MDGIEGRIAWKADGEPLELGLTRFGQGPTLLMLPALSSISTRRELWGLQQHLGGAFSTIAVDWPGFGDLPRPKLDWRPEHYRKFLRFLAEEYQPAATIAAGHGAGYCLGQAGEAPGSLGRIVLLSPTWRGPLPTMAGKRMGLFRGLARSVDMPGLGAGVYRMNVNRPVIRMMARGHVYDDPDWLNEERMWEKRRVTEAPGARYCSVRFVAGELDPFLGELDFLKAGQKAQEAMLLLYAKDAPPKSKAEMQLLASLENIQGLELSSGKLSFYEEFPDVTAQAIMSWLSEESAPADEEGESPDGDADKSEASTAETPAQSPSPAEGP